MERVEINCELLVVGGGMAGCYGAIRGASLGLDTILVEKANTKRSGAGAVGLDHLATWMPDYHGKKGISSDDIAEAHAKAFGYMAQLDLYKVAYKNSFDRILDLEKMGVNIRYEKSPVEFPGGVRLVKQASKYVDTINYDGRDMKRRMTEECHRRGVKIVNRVMITDPIVREGRIVGAVGVGTRDGKLYIFRAKAVILSTARIAGGRFFAEPGPGAGVMMNLRWPPSATGDGKTFALRAGAEVINMEYTQPMLTSKNLVRGGGFPNIGTYAPPGRSVDAYGNQLQAPKGHGHFEDAPKEMPKDMVPDKNPLIELAKGNGPIYGDLTQGTEDEIQYVEWSATHEGLSWAFMHIMKQEGLDFRTHMIELNQGEVELGNVASAGLWVESNCETPVKGLFAAGDEIGAIPLLCGNGALTLGWYSAECAKDYLDKANAAPGFSDDCDEINAVEAYCSAALDCADGNRWQDAQIALNSIMSFYCNKQKTEAMLYRGLENLDDLKANMNIKADNPHELHRALEMRNLTLSAECMLQGARERKETRMLETPLPKFR